ncbi:VOC family protein [Emcibacter nanhaiensis]|uniref:VOC family protein n=1 Tax=Emcibacter nanhaiensis TaxID=1505037 RepID=A0A501PAX9_9PROT|nr:VOC family protein [Emcibacter nanhaiensis]TPD57348.1 VOC family protein [Emcibacter nanhaiensis]
MHYGFGQPHDGIMQTGFIVPDLKAAIDHWVRDLKVGPWFVFDHFTGIDPIYRGGPSKADSTIAMSFAGHMNIELIQPLDDNPSVYKEFAESRGYGFHHYGLSTTRFDEEIEGYKAKGYELAFLAGVPTGGRVAYMENGVNQPGMVELIEYTDSTDEAFTAMYSAALTWDGSDPVRPFG